MFCRSTEARARVGSHRRSRAARDTMSRLLRAILTEAVRGQIPTLRALRVSCDVALGYLASELRDETRQAERPRPGSVLIKSTGHTLEVVPPFDRLHAAEYGVQIVQWAIAAGTPQRGCRNVRVLRHDRRPHRSSSPTAGGCGRILAHTDEWSNRLAVSPLRNPVQFAAAVSLFSSIQVSVRRHSHDKGLAACDLSLGLWFTLRAPGPPCRLRARGKRRVARVRRRRLSA
jgi:hypothetical protein